MSDLFSKFKAQFSKKEEPDYGSMTYIAAKLAYLEFHNIQFVDNDWFSALWRKQKVGQIVAKDEVEIYKAKPTPKSELPEEPPTMEEFFKDVPEEYKSKIVSHPFNKEVDFSSMPQGQKELQQANGVKDHGLSPKQEVIVVSEPPVDFKEHQVVGKTEFVEKFLEDHGQEELFIMKTNIGPEIKPSPPIPLSKPEYKFIDPVDVEEGTMSTSNSTVDKPKMISVSQVVKDFLDKPKDSIPFPELLEEMVKYSPHAISEKPQAWVGIDPGKTGGIVAITDREIVGKWVIPLLGKDVDAKGIWDILDDLKSKYDITLILEEVHSLHKMSASTNFSMGHTLGIILGIVISSKIKLIRVQPKAWQKEVWITSEIEYLPKKPDQDKPSIDTKLTSMKAAHRLFPNDDFRKSNRATNPHDGICDSVCLAEYGRRKKL